MDDENQMANWDFLRRMIAENPVDDDIEFDEFLTCCDQPADAFQSNQRNQEAMREALASNGIAPTLNKLSVQDKNPALRAVSDQEHVTVNLTASISSGLPSVATSKEFEYPPLPLDVSKVSHDHLVQRLSELAADYRATKDYESIRRRFVIFSLALNQFGLLAPAFRDQPRMPYSRDAWENATQLLIDLIVIDCHWLHSRGESISSKWSDLVAMFDRGALFDCKLVVQSLAAKNWTMDFRVNDLLTLTPRQQIELSQLRDKSVKKQFRFLLNGKKDDSAVNTRSVPKAAKVRMAIKTYMENAKGRGIRGQEAIYEGIWLGIELLGVTAKNEHIANFAAFTCGLPPVSPRTMSSKIVTLKKILSGAGISIGS